MVDVIVVVTGDSDMVPAFKFARREGIRIYLDYLVPVQGSGKRRIRVPGTLWQRILDLDTGTRPPHRAS
jgi:hypothetical protein